MKNGGENVQLAVIPAVISATLAPLPSLFFTLMAWAEMAAKTLAI